MYVYKITNSITKEFYIGKTKNDVEKRFNRHCYLASIKSNDSIYLYRAIRKYGQDNFDYEILETVINEELLNEKEKELIQKFKPSYNMTTGGDGGNTSMSEKYVEYMKFHSEYMKGENNPFYGHKHSEETKRKISNSNKFKKRTIEFKMRISELQKGKKPSKETIEKRVEKISKEWCFINPNGEIIQIKNLSKFCRENNLDQGNMSRLISGEGKTYKGYKRFE